MFGFVRLPRKLRSRLMRNDMSCVLIVEDEAPIRETLVEVIRDAGYEVMESETADAAVAVLDEPLLRLLLTDINLPGRLDGVELAGVARERRPSMPVVFISGRPARLADAKDFPNPV